MRNERDELYGFVAIVSNIGEKANETFTRLKKNLFIRHPITFKTILLPLPEILTAAGGLLGLCMGFSMLSGVELLYFAAKYVASIFTRARPK